MHLQTSDPRLADADPARDGLARPLASRLRRLICAWASGALLVAGWAGIYVHRRPDVCLARSLSDSQSNNPSRIERLKYEVLNLEAVQSLEGQVSLLQARLLIAEERYAEALEALSVADSFDETRLQALILAGEALYRGGRFLEAGRAWSEALQLEPDNIDAHRWLGVAYFELGAVAEAQSHLEQVAHLAPSDPRPHRVLGLIWRELDEYRSAVEAYRESLRRDPRQPDAETVRFELADALHRQSDNREALRLLDECPISSASLALRASCHYNLADAKKAVDLLDRALASDPGNVSALSLRAKISLDRGDAKTALRFLQRAVRVSPNNTGVLHTLMAANLRLGRRDEAKAQERLLEKINQWIEEYHTLVSQAAHDPADADLRYRLGILATRLDFDEAAKSWLTASVRLDPNNAESVAALNKLNHPYKQLQSLE